MKTVLITRLLPVLLISILSLTATGQSPQKLNYQAVARDASGNPITDTDVEVTITIRQYSTDGADIFQEVHNLSTNGYGLLNLSIGSVEDLSVITWEDGPFFLKVDIDGVEVGISELLSVPYALYSPESDPIFMSSVSKGISSGDITSWNSAVSWGDHALAGYLKSTNWALNSNKLSYSNGYVGVGTVDPRSRLSVQGISAEDLILFEVKNSLGQTVFAVYNQGVHITIDEDYSKGSRGGFSVGGFDRVKGVQEYMRVTADSTRVYINQNAKGPRGGFSVGGFDRSAGKGATFNYVTLTPSNSLLGPSAGENMVSGRNNFFAGYQAGMLNEDGDDNIFIGTGAGLNNNSNANIFIGVGAGGGNTTAFGSVIIGDNAGIVNNGSRNIIIGRRTAMANTTGDNSIYIGNDAGQTLTTSRDNTFVGAEAGFRSLTGSYDVYLGHRAGYDNDGSYNVVIGELAGSNKNTYGNDNTTYDHSVFVGNMSGYSNTTGDYNSFFGDGSGANVTTGDHNTYLGAAAGSNLNGSYNVAIGYGAGASTSGDNKLVIHNSTTGTPLIYGEFHSVPSAALFQVNGAFEVTEMGTGSGTPVVIDANGELLKSSSSMRYKDDIESLSDVTDTFMSLRPVSFRWNETTATPGKEDYGLIAEEVAEVLPELSIVDSDGTPEGVSYHNVNIMAIQVIQSQQKEIEALKKRLEETEEKINRLLEGKK